MNTDRLRPTLDVDTLAHCHVTVVGGAYGFIRNLVRCGILAVTLIDFDRVSGTNPARQDFYSDDIGRHKIEATARDVKRINPDVQVECLARDFCEMSGAVIQQHLGHTDLLVFATDFFPAQARGSVVAQQLHKPALWIGLYRGGRAGEIIYSVPGVTRACYRCIGKDRYRAFAATPSVTSVPSSGATIFDLHLVDSVAGQIALGILTRGADNRYGRLIDQLGNRNLLQIKIDPGYRLGEKDIFGQYLGTHRANFSFTTIAVPQESEPSCPDCGGNGGSSNPDATDGEHAPDSDFVIPPGAFG